MLKFFRPRDHLFQWAGIVQQSTIKKLFSLDEFSPQDLSGLVDFCFPTEDPISGPLSFVFRYRIGSSDCFVNSFCLLDQTSFQLKDLDTNQQCCICLLSPFYHFDVYDDILKIIRSLLLMNIASAESFLKVLYNSPQSISSIPSLSKLFTSNTPYDVMSSTISSYCFSFFDPQMIAQIVLAVISDTSIIAISSDLSIVSQFCYSLLALIYPLKWYLIFTPILPHRFTDSLMSPTPFIVGMHKIMSSVTSKLDIEQHVSIDLDQKKVIFNLPSDFQQWLIKESSSVKMNTPNEYRGLIIKSICSALSIPPSTSPITTARRIISSFQSSSHEVNTFLFQVLHSRTLKTFFDALNQKPISTEFLTMLSVGLNTSVPSPAVQNIDEFPLRKHQVARSSSYQFSSPTKNEEMRPSISVSLLNEEAK